jgi:hypothetical protein
VQNQGFSREIKDDPDSPAASRLDLDRGGFRRRVHFHSLRQRIDAREPKPLKRNPDLG